MKLADMTITQFTQTLASDAPAPGGGSVAALCGAQGAALCAMVCRLTIGREKYADFQEICIPALPQAEELMAKLLKIIDDDTDAYNEISAAFKLPKTTDAEKSLRSAAIQQATIRATETPLSTLALANDCLTLAKKLDGHTNPNANSDLGVAMSCLETAKQGAYLNVMINTPGIKNEQIRIDFETKAKKLLN